MSDIWLAWGAILLGFVGLVWSADRFVAGSAAIARNIGVSKLIIGLTIVSLGTSAPEIVVSISAALKGAGDLAVGNAIGSNIANIGMVLAVTALIAPLPIYKHLLTQEMPILLGVTLLAGCFVMDAELATWEGAILAGLIIPLISWMIYSKRHHPNPEDEDPEIEDLSTALSAVWFIVGLGTLIVSSELLVWGATTVATSFGVSPLIIGLTVVAVGTSLPELAASVMSAIKGHHDIALGNIVGSNIFNLLAVMSVPGLLGPLTMSESVFYRDYLAMGGITAFLAVVMFLAYRLRQQGDNGKLGRTVGALLLTSYIAYYTLLFV
ncbi:calcium/sodium antiporter [Marinibactrum halimedae]|uniref:Sodium:calcium antiporter n=1 Tax=Marinibactrum halimedae TaxID=1444977 RepID=A0AA37WNY2_9GAMM|nr:calcium/sodium antiporter [Marinibactrum halimedae]MCD9457529.1 calcium/sodium antiporter [Marinibactrum halimedae]GLS25417.1 sodium:calcium antiporter [Marinibactrum halimedae]